VSFGVGTNERTNERTNDDVDAAASRSSRAFSSATDEKMVD
jgi:hypothetical protein